MEKKKEKGIWPRFTLQKEADDFVKKNAPKSLTPQDRIALRFYMGSALTGLIARSPSQSRIDEIIKEAYEYAKNCLEFESKF